MLNFIFLVLLIAGAIFVAIASITMSTKDEGGWRTFFIVFLLIPLAIYDEVKTYGGRRAFLGFSKEEFAAYDHKGVSGKHLQET